METTFGILVHPGGVIAVSPPVTITMLQAVARVSGLELHLMAELPADPRRSLERQSDIRSWSDGVAPAPRVLLPVADEGTNLRVGWVDDNGRARWVYAWSGDSSSGTGRGRQYRGRFIVPMPIGPKPAASITIVLAWPEIGFEESTFVLHLPDRIELERACKSIWAAPVTAGVRPPAGLQREPGQWRKPLGVGQIGRIVGDPQVLLRGQLAVVALTRLSEQGDLLAAEITSEARGSTATTIRSAIFPRRRPDADPSRRPDPRVGVGVQLDGVIRTCPPKESIGTGGDDGVRQVSTFLLPKPLGEDLQLIVSWPMADLAETLIAIPIRPVGTK